MWHLKIKVLSTCSEKYLMHYDAVKNKLLLTNSRDEMQTYLSIESLMQDVQAIVSNNMQYRNSKYEITIFHTDY